MGVLPLVLAKGAGAEMRHAMGVAVFAGMLGVTMFGLFLTPVFFVTIETLFGAKHASEPQTKPNAAPGPAGAQENA
jgi:multidrug efflux pump